MSKSTNMSISSISSDNTANNNDQKQQDNIDKNNKRKNKRKKENKVYEHGLCGIDPGCRTVVVILINIEINY